MRYFEVSRPDPDDILYSLAATAKKTNPKETSRHRAKHKWALSSTALERYIVSSIREEKIRSEKKIMIWI